MTIFALRMALEAADAAFAAAACVAFASWAPSRSTCHPTDFCFTHWTFQPVTAPFFHQYHLKTDICRPRHLPFILSRTQSASSSKHTLHVGQYIASPFSTISSSIFLDVWLSVLPSSFLAFSWYCLQSKPSWMTCNFNDKKKQKQTKHKVKHPII